MWLMLLLASGLLAAPMPLAVESVAVSAEGNFIQEASGELVQRLEGALSQAKVDVAFRASSFYDSAPPPTDLRLGVRLAQIECRFLDEALVRCEVEMDFELYHRPSDTVVLRAHSSQEVSAMDFEDGVARAVLAGARRLAVHEDFLERLDSGFYSPPPPAEAVLPCEDQGGRALIEGTLAGVELLGLDPQGKILVAGSRAEAVQVRIQGGPTLQATRVREGEDAGIYQLPVLGGLACAPDDEILPRPLGGHTTVGEVLQSLGVERTERAPLPEVRHVRLE